MAFDNPVGAAGRNVADVGLPDLIACDRIGLPTFAELALVLADPVLVVGDVGRDAIEEVLADIVLPSELKLDTPVGHFGDVLLRSAGVAHYHIH